MALAGVGLELCLRGDVEDRFIAEKEVAILIYTLNYYICVLTLKMTI